VPLSPDDLLEPAGPIAPSFFPNESPSALATRLQAYLDDGARRVSATGLGGTAADDAVRAWAEYRAFNAVTNRLAVEAQSVTIADQGARTRSVEQLRMLALSRDAALARWNALVPAPSEVSGSAATPPRGTSGSTAIRYTW
jgi:hypothetical protein